MSSWTNPANLKEKNTLKNKINELRKPLQSIALGEIIIEKYGIEHDKTGGEEFTYWDAFIRECINNALSNDEIHHLLKETQPNYDFKETNGHIKWIRKKKTLPLTNETLSKLFPEYQLTLSENREKLYKQFYNETKTIATYPAKGGIICEKKAFKNWNKKRKLKKIKKEEKDDENNELFIQEFGNLIKTVSFNDCEIEIRDFGIFKVIEKETQTGEPFYLRTLMLDGKIEILFKVYDSKLKIDRFSFLLKNEQFNTLTVMEILKKLEYRSYGTSYGKDIIKRVFNYLSDNNKIETRTPEYVIGFNNGWKLPQLEKESEYAIISYTDIDNAVYENAKNIIKEYSEIEKQHIIEDLKAFIETTQTPPEKLAVIILWSIVAPFRLPIIEYFKIFPFLYNYGERQSGKGSLEEFWMIKFYGLYEKLLPSKTLESPSRLEDYSAASTFPIAITEADGHNIKNTLSVIKELATDITDFERKKDAKNLEFRKMKTAGLCLDSNIIIEEFKDSALNSKSISLEFKREEKPKIDFAWKKLFRKLSKKKLFSFIFDYTKDWTNNEIFKIFEKISENIKTDLKDYYNEIEDQHPRIISIYTILLFGLYIFNNSFNLSLEETLNIIKEDILEELIAGRKVVSMNLIDQFYNFCISAICFDEGYTDENGNYHRGDNPKYLTCKLKEHKNEIQYAFIYDNLRDFNEYTNNKYSMPRLFDGLQDGLEKKDDIIYSNCKPFKNQKQMKVILINKTWFN